MTTAAAVIPLSEEETNLVDRSNKRVKGGEQVFSGTSSGPVKYDDLVDPASDHEETKKVPSYRDVVLGDSSSDDEENFDDASDGEGDDMMTDEETSQDEEQSQTRPGVTIVEKKEGIYGCPQFILSPEEEERLKRPWRYGVIVRLLGRKIGFKALEARLQQMWIRKGVLHLIDSLAWMIT